MRVLTFSSMERVKESRHSTPSSRMSTRSVEFPPLVAENDQSELRTRKSTTPVLNIFFEPTEPTEFLSPNVSLDRKTKKKWLAISDKTKSVFTADEEADLSFSNSGDNLPLIFPDKVSREIALPKGEFVFNKACPRKVLQSLESESSETNKRNLLFLNETIFYSLSRYAGGDKRSEMKNRLLQSRVEQSTIGKTKNFRNLKSTAQIQAESHIQPCQLFSSNMQLQHYTDKCAGKMQDLQINVNAVAKAQNKNSCFRNKPNIDFHTKKPSIITPLVGIFKEKSSENDTANLSHRLTIENLFENLPNLNTHVDEICSVSSPKKQQKIPLARMPLKKQKPVKNFKLPHKGRRMKNKIASKHINYITKNLDVKEKRPESTRFTQNKKSSRKVSSLEALHPKTEIFSNSDLQILSPCLDVPHAKSVHGSNFDECFLLNPLDNFPKDIGSHKMKNVLLDAGFRENSEKPTLSSVAMDSAAIRPIQELPQDVNTAACATEINSFGRFSHGHSQVYINSALANNVTYFTESLLLNSPDSFSSEHPTLRNESSDFDIDDKVLEKIVPKNCPMEREPSWKEVDTWVEDILNCDSSLLSNPASLPKSSEKMMSFTKCNRTFLMNLQKKDSLFYSYQNAGSQISVETSEACSVDDRKINTELEKKSVETSEACSVDGGKINTEGERKLSLLLKVGSHISDKTAYKLSLSLPHRAKNCLTFVNGVDQSESLFPTYSTNSETVDLCNWKRGKVLGRGAYGTVWCGLTENGELIAVKQIELNVIDNLRAKQEYEKIQEEIGLLKTLKHKNIVGYLGTCVKDNLVSIFMQFIPGGSIASLLIQFGPLEETVFCRFTKQLLKAVEFLHDKNIIHRDIKGSNIMLMPNRGVIKLIDFGCAKRLCFTISENSLFFSKSIHGTPYWMAPEVVSETGHGKKSDIWSIGCTVFEMATQKPPWSEMTPMAAIFAIGSDQAVPVLPDSFSPEACDFTSACLTRDHCHRPNATGLLSHPFVLKLRKRRNTNMNKKQLKHLT